MTMSKNKLKQEATKHNKKTLIIVGGLLFLATGGVVWMYSTHQAGGTQDAITSTKTGGENKSFIVPEIVKADEVSNALSIGERNILENKLQTLITSKQKDGTIRHTGLYFRDLSRGPVIAINEDLKFEPASLLKLPLAIWFYYQASTSPDFLTQEIQYLGPKGSERVHYSSPETIQVGSIYTYQELIRIMLQDSDNDATSVLGGIAGIKNTDTVYKDLGVTPVADYSKYTTNVQSYSSFFRVLYYATYLSRTSSNDILKILSKTTFTDGLVAGLPPGTVVSHKFGERPISSDSSNSVQLHDCGIVYPPNKQNYLICIMTQGDSYDKEARFIAEMSKIVYESVTK